MQPKSFVYDIPVRVYFGPDQLEKLGGELSKYGTRVLLCYGGGSVKRTGLFDRIAGVLEKAGLTLFEFGGIEPNPRVESVKRGAELCREKDIDVLLAVGGGSVIDCVKFIAAARYYDGDPWDLVIKKAPIERCLPIVTVLTLAATGSEMDRIGVISNMTTKEKLSNNSPLMLPKASFLDPTLTYSVSRFQTASGSADILSHIFEIYFVPESSSMYLLDRFKEGMMKTVIKYAPIALEEPDNYEARENLMWTASWAINGFASSKLGVSWSCHPMEHELSAFYDITHGLGLAILTPRWMEYILDETTAFRFYDYGVNVFGIDPSLPQMEVAREAIERTREFLFGTLGLASTLTEVGIGEDHIPEMARKAAASRGGKIPGFKTLMPEDIEKIFRACL